MTIPTLLFSSIAPIINPLVKAAETDRRDVAIQPKRLALDTVSEPLQPHFSLRIEPTKGHSPLGKNLRLTWEKPDAIVLAFEPLFRGILGENRLGRILKARGSP